MSPAALSVLEFLGARIADNDIRDLRDGSGFIAMRDKDGHKSPRGRERGRKREVTDAGLSIHGERPTKGQRRGGSRAVLLDQRGVPLALDGRFIADGGIDGHRTSLRKGPLGHKVWDRGQGLPGGGESVRARDLGLRQMACPGIGGGRRRHHEQSAS